MERGAVAVNTTQNLLKVHPIIQLPTYFAPRKTAYCGDPAALTTVALHVIAPPPSAKVGDIFFHGCSIVTTRPLKKVCEVTPVLAVAVAPESVPDGT
jgi:hypothetical protein